MKGRKSHYIYANRKSLELFGCTAEALCGRTDADFFPADAVETLRDVDVRVVQRRKHLRGDQCRRG